MNPTIETQAARAATPPTWRQMLALTAVVLALGGVAYAVLGSQAVGASALTALHCPSRSMRHHPEASPWRCPKSRSGPPNWPGALKRALTMRSDGPCWRVATAPKDVTLTRCQPTRRPSHCAW